MKSLIRFILLAAFLGVVSKLHAADSVLRVTCEGSDVGAEVWINGKFRGECPVDLKIPAGALKLLVRKKVDADREQLFQQDIRMGEDSIKKVEIQLSAPRLTAEGQKRADERKAVAEEIFKQGVSRLKLERNSENLVEALRLFRIAATQGHAAAQVFLGVMFMKGYGGLPKDEVEAVRLWKLAASQGDAMGQFNLGLMYFNGYGGLNKDDVEAVRLWKLSAAQGDPSAQFNLGLMYFNGGGGLNKDDVEAVRLWKLSAAQGDPSAQASLGLMYQNGRGGLNKDEVEAIRLYKLAAAEGDASGQARLAIMYMKGLGGLTKDDVEAVRLLKLAAAQGDRRADAILKQLGKSM